ncbi:phage tail tape measure protein [Clostridium algidicarnis]|nr:phage tail tape measure protein [Clostridium algidicarnis]
MKKAEKQTGTFAGRLELLGKEFEKIDKKYEAFDKVGDKFQSVGKKFTMGVTLPVVGAGVAVTKAAIDFESAFTGVKKTVDGTEEQFAQLKQGIRDMTKEMPQSATEISGVAEAAGQLGIKTESILSFTKTMVMLGDSTNMSSDQAATSLARLANITQMSQGDFDKLGSVVVSLGNNLATTESEIVDMGLRLAGAGKQIGLTEAQTLSFAGALSSVGIEAEAGGSAFSKIMVDMQLAVETGNKDLKNFAKVAGVSSQEFQRAFKEDATGALISFIKGLETSKDKGESAIKVLDEMGISEVRMRDALLRASGAGDLFSDSIKIGTKAWEENIALTNEAGQRYETTESKLKIMKNQLVDAGIDIGEKLIPHVVKVIEGVGKLADGFGNLSPVMQDNIIKIGLASAALGPFASGIGGAIKGVTGLLKTGKKVGTFFGLFKGASIAAKATAGMGTAATVATGAAGGGGMLGLAASFGPLLIAALPWVAGAGAVAGAGYLIHKQLSKETIPTIDLFADKVVTTGENVNAAYSGMAGNVETETIKISEGTKKAVGAYMDLDKGATDALNNLYFNSTAITEDNKNVLIGKYTEMGTMINQGLQQKRDEDISSLSEFFATTNTLTDAEESLILQKTNEHYEERKSVTDIYQQQITDIIQNAAENNRGINEQEYKTITDIKQRQKEESIKVLSENEVEAGVILERMKEYDGRITAEQASKHINTLNESRDKAVQIANDEYEKRVAAILRTKSESSSMTQEQADKLIAEAARQRDGIIEKAEDTRITAIEKMRSMNKDLDASVDTTTGNILSTWDKISRWWNGWKPEKKNFSYDVSGGGGGNNRAAVAMNASGTSNFSGGLTTMHERGYEVYNLPQGSRIYNHQASEAMVRETAKEVAQSVLQGMDIPGGGDIIIPISIAGEEIDRIVVPRVSSRLALNTMGRR